LVLDFVIGDEVFRLVEQLLAISRLSLVGVLSHLLLLDDQGVLLLLGVESSVCAVVLRIYGVGNLLVLQQTSSHQQVVLHLGRTLVRWVPETLRLLCHILHSERLRQI
jgi:hypothetical protein